MNTYQGSCHCSAVRFEVNFKEQPKSAMVCNCSMCQRAGWMLEFVPAEDFKLLSGEDMLTDYQFNRNIIHHTFCKTCGIKPFSRGKGHAGEDMVAVNLRCLHDFETEGLELKPFNGKDF